MECLHDIDHSPFGPAYPICKLHIVRYSGTEHDNSDMFRQHNDSLFPDNPSFLIVYVVNLIENDPLNVPYHLGPSV